MYTFCITGQEVAAMGCKLEFVFFFVFCFFSRSFSQKITPAISVQSLKLCTGYMRQKKKIEYSILTCLASIQERSLHNIGSGRQLLINHILNPPEKLEHVPAQTHFLSRKPTVSLKKKMLRFCFVLLQKKKCACGFM